MITLVIERFELQEEFAAVVYADGVGRDGLAAWLPEAFETSRIYLEKWGAGPKCADPFLRVLDGELVAGYLATTPVGGEGDVEPAELPAGPAATTLHEGGDGTVEETYEALRAWVLEQGGAVAEDGWEVFPGGDLARRIVVLPFR